MLRSTFSMVLIGTFSCSLLASSAETKHIDRELLRKAVERYVQEQPGTVPDLRFSADEQAQRLAESRRRERTNQTEPQVQSTSFTGKESAADSASFKKLGD